MSAIAIESGASDGEALVREAMRDVVATLQDDMCRKDAEDMASLMYAFTISQTLLKAPPSCEASVRKVVEECEDSSWLAILCLHGFFASSCEDRGSVYAA